MLLRPRRMRSSEGIRSLVRETIITPDDFVYPLFIVPGKNIKKKYRACQSAITYR